MIFNLRRTRTPRADGGPDRRPRERLLVVAAGALATLLVCGLMTLRPLILDRILNATYDLQLSLLPQTSPSQVPIIVDVDDRSLVQFGQWHWPRNQVASLLSALADAGVKAVGVDVLFAEPDRTSPVVVQHRLERELGGEVLLEGIPESHRDYDAVLASTLASGPFVTGFYFDFRDGATRGCSPRSASIALLSRVPDTLGPEGLHSADGVLCNIQRISDAAVNAGFINSRPDDDGIYRRTPLLIEYQGRIYPSLSLQTLLTAAGVRQLSVESHSDGLTLQLGDRRIPLDAAANLLVRFRGGAGSYDFVSAASVLSGQVDPARPRGRIAFLGVSATGLAEYRPIPLDPLFTGVEFHATLVDNILKGDYLVRPQIGSALELASALFAGLSFALVLAWVGPLTIALLTPLALTSSVTMSQLLLSQTGLALSPVPAMLAVISVVLVGSLSKYRREQVRRKNVLRQIALSQEATIEGFAAMAEFRDPDTGGHIRRIQHYVKALAEQLQRRPDSADGLDDVTIELL